MIYDRCTTDAERARALLSAIHNRLAVQSGGRRREVLISPEDHALVLGQLGDTAIQSIEQRATLIVSSLPRGTVRVRGGAVYT